jgi:starch phosphorylase
VLDAIGSDMFCDKETGIFRPIYDKILGQGDYYFHLADFQSYSDTHKKAAQ